MKKTIVVLLSVLFLLPAFVLPCLAEGVRLDRAALDRPHVIDEADLLTDAEEAEFSKRAEEIETNSGFDVIIVLENGTSGDSDVDMANEYFRARFGDGKDQRGGLLFITESGFTTMFTNLTRAADDNSEEANQYKISDLLSDHAYAEACRAFVDYVQYLAEPEPANILADGASSAETGLPRVVDEADLFTADEEAALSSRIAAVGSEFSFDVVVVTTTDLGGKTDMAFADDYYDYNGYGYGENKDGCLLLIHMDADRGYWISTTGLGIKALSDADIDRIGEDIVPLLTAGDYAAACDTFLDDVSEEVNIAINGRGFRPMLLVIGLVIGLVVAFVVVSVLKGQLKSVRFKPGASDYFVNGSLALTGAYDVLVGHHVTRTKRQNESSGSSTHTGSSGTSHGGGGGRF